MNLDFCAADFTNLIVGLHPPLSVVEVPIEPQSSNITGKVDKCIPQIRNPLVLPVLTTMILNMHTRTKIINLPTYNKKIS